MIHKIRRFYKTASYLKPVQIRYRLWYRFRAIFRVVSRFSYPVSIPKEGCPLVLTKPPDHTVSVRNGIFTFLNRPGHFTDGVEWNDRGLGLLWLYQLNSFNFLQQKGMDSAVGLSLVRSFVQQLNRPEGVKDGMDPYPLSIRCLNWVKFLVRHSIDDREIDASLYAQYQILTDNLEYHLLGNHLLENGFSLFAGGIYFGDKEFFETGRKILAEQIPEQVLDDGGHIERSPMYHALLLEHLLDCLNLMQNVTDLNMSRQSRDVRIPDSFHSMLISTASRMTGWLQNMTFQNGDPAHFNDSVFGLALSTSSLVSYLERLGFATAKSDPGTSGYRRFTGSNYECIVDAGDIGPDYQPGHAHSDTFSFILHHGGHPVIVDRGISTYEDISRRLSERRTSSHNTFCYNGREQSEMWSLFRVADRAYCRITEESRNELKAEHDGYRFWGVKAVRSFHFGRRQIDWVDEVMGGDLSAESTGFIHFHPDLDIRIDVDTVQSDQFVIRFDGATGLRLDEYDYCEGFNLYRTGQKVEVKFGEKLTTSIHFQ